MTVKEIFFALLRVEVCGGDLPEGIKDALTMENVETLYKLSKAQDMVHLIGDALLRYNLLPQDKEIYQKFIGQRRLAVYRREQLNYDLEKIGQLLEEIQVEYLPLKGSVLQAYYPEAWMRTSCDIDILVEKENISKCAEKLQANEYTLEGDHYHDLSFYSANNVHLELHYELIENRNSEEGHEILSTLWEKLLPVDGFQYKKRMPEEYFYFYHIAHMAKHFVYGGCGVRPFLDLWIMEREMQCDKEKLHELLNRSNLYVFYTYAKKVANHWFSNEKTEETVLLMENFVLRGGLYGSMENKVSISREKPKSKMRWVLSTIFLPYWNLCQIYPSLQGKKILTPFYQVRRWFRILFKGTSSATKNTLRAYGNVSNEQKQDVQTMLDTLKL